MSRLGFLVTAALAAVSSPSGAFAAERATTKTTEIAAGPAIATGPLTPTPKPPNDESFFRFLFEIDGGVAIINRDTVGGFARLGGDGTVVKNLQRSRFAWGLWDAYEGWLAKDGWGFALPVVAYIGYRKAPFLATLGGGVNVFSVDRLDDDTGAGIFSPRGDLRVGVDFDAFVVMAHSDVQYRWLWGRDDISLIQLGLSIGIGPGFQQPEPEAPPRRN